MTTLTPTPEDVAQSFDYMERFRKPKQNDFLHPWVAAKHGYLDGLLAERQRGLLNLAKERERSERLLTQLEGLVLCFKEHGTNLNIPFLIDQLNTSIESYEKESGL